MRYKAHTLRTRAKTKAEAPKAPEAPSLKLCAVNVRLFADDVEAIKQIAAAKSMKYQTELRLLVRRALRGEHREVTVLREIT